MPVELHDHPSPLPLAQWLLDRPGVRSAADVQALEEAFPDPLAGVTSTYALLRRGALRNPDAPALSFFLETQDFARPVTWTHREWFERITRMANLLRGLGIGRQDTVAFVLPNLPETHWVIWGGEAAGAVLALNPLLDAAMLRELMNAVRPKVLVTLAPQPDGDLWDRATAAAREVPSLETLLTVAPQRYAPGAAAATAGLAPARIGSIRVLDLHEALWKVPGQGLAFAPPALDDVASYFCTGGTTGMPKIAVRTHRTEAANALQLAAMFGRAAASGPLFCGLPLFHVNAQIGTGLMPWSLGGHVVLGTPGGYRSRDLIARFWEIAAHYGLFSFSGVPTIYSALLQAPRTAAIPPSLRYGICGAAPMPFELIRRFEQETGIRILEGYGLTEGGCVSTLNPPEGTPRPGSIGIRLPWQQVKALVPGGAGSPARAAAAGEAGTLAIRGPNLFAGYLLPAHNEAAWMETEAQPGSPPQRWLHTGDLGRVDAEGFFWLTGRSKELIIRGGHNIDPRIIEEPLHAHGDVALAAAVPRPDAHAGEVPVAYVQLRPGARATPDELQAWLQQRIAERAAWPRQVHILPALPVTAVGKLFKPALVDREIAAVVREEALAAGVDLASCEVLRDPARGTVVRWSAAADAAVLRERLARYTFRHEEA
jgi:acyl-CoA synthetase (AMP-forming)/AMP-acid ligase II